MSLIASKETFEGGPDAWYDPPYHRYAFFTDRADAIAKMAKGRVLVVGCGYGYLVDELVARGVNAAGIDLSDYAIAKGKSELPQIADRISVGDARHDVTGRWSMIVTEDILPCMSDDEIVLTVGPLRSHTNRLIHIVTPFEYNGGVSNVQSMMNWKTPEMWAAMLAPDPVYDPHMSVRFA